MPPKPIRREPKEVPKEVPTRDRSPISPVVLSWTASPPRAPALPDRASQSPRVTRTIQSPRASPRNTRPSLSPRMSPRIAKPSLPHRVTRPSQSPRALRSSQSSSRVPAAAQQTPEAVPHAGPSVDAGSEPTRPKRKSFGTSATRRPEKPVEDGPAYKWPTIDLFGDDIVRDAFNPGVRGFASRIANKVTEHFDVHVRAYNGYDSKQLLELMPRLYKKEYLSNCAAMVLFLGHFDPFEQHPGRCSPWEFAANVQAMVRYLLDNGLPPSKIVLVSPGFYYKTDFDELIRCKGLPKFNKSLERCRQFSEAMIHVSVEFNLKSCDFFHSTNVARPLRDVFIDGIRLSRKGHDMLMDLLMSHINTIISEHYGVNKLAHSQWQHYLDFQSVSLFVEGYRLGRFDVDRESLRSTDDESD